MALRGCARIIPSAPATLTASAQPEGHGDATAAPAGRRVQDADPEPGSFPAVHSVLHSSTCTGPDSAPLPSAEPLALRGAPHHHVLWCPRLSVLLQLAPHRQTPPEHPLTTEGTSSTRSTLEKLCFPPLAAAEIESFSTVIYFPLSEKLFFFPVLPDKPIMQAADAAEVAHGIAPSGTVLHRAQRQGIFGCAAQDAKGSCRGHNSDALGGNWAHPSP